MVKKLKEKKKRNQIKIEKLEENYKQMTFFLKIKRRWKIKKKSK